MNRRKFLAAALAAPFAGGLTLPTLRALDQGPPLPKWRRFQVSTFVTLPDAAGPAQLWMPLCQTAADGYQSSLHLDWSSTGRTECVYDARYNAPMLRTAWEEKNRAERKLEVWQIIDVRDRTTDPRAEFVGTSTDSPLRPLTEAERQFWTASTPSAPLDGVVLATAAKITAGRNTPRERLRAIYDWVVDHTHRDPDVPGCGRGDIRAMLEKGQFGGKCADINGLMVGLARAAGFPAREVYGIRVGKSASFPSLGASGDVSKAQHCRAEVFLDGAGWFPVDPADVAKVVLAEKLAPGSPEVRALRERLFGSWEMNWVGYNSATDIVLPGSDGTQKPDFAFLMYPCAFTAEGSCPCLDPAKFRYEITSREITV